jgi:group I intron endonuclease
MARGIYKIINVINNKFYVGSAVDLKRRKARHFSELRNGRHNNRHLQAAWGKYGEQAFVFVVIEELPADADLLAAENVWLHEHVGKDYCYNIGVDAISPTLGWSGEKSPTWGRKRTPEELAAQNWTGRKHRDDSKEQIRQFLIGKPKSAEVRAKISATLSGEGNYWYGKKRPDHGQKVSKAVAVTDPSGNVSSYPSISAVRSALELTPPTVNRALKSGAPIKRGKFSGWTFKYVATADGS